MGQENDIQNLGKLAKADIQHRQSPAASNRAGNERRFSYPTAFALLCFAIILLR